MGEQVAQNKAVLPIILQGRLGIKCTAECCEQSFGAGSMHTLLLRVANLSYRKPCLSVKVAANASKPLPLFIPHLFAGDIL